MGHLVTTLYLDQQALLDIARELLMYHVIVVRYCMYTIAFSALTLLVGRQEGHPAFKKTEWWGTGVVICLELRADCIWPSWCHCHSLSLASVKSRLVLPFWYRLTRVVPDKEPLNGCVCVRACVYCIQSTEFFIITFSPTWWNTSLNFYQWCHWPEIQFVHVGLIFM